MRRTVERGDIWLGNLGTPRAACVVQGPRPMSNCEPDQVDGNLELIPKPALGDRDEFQEEVQYENEDGGGRPCGGAGHPPDQRGRGKRPGQRPRLGEGQLADCAHPQRAYPRATGSAQYQTQPGQREFQAEVDHIRSLAGSRVTVKVNGGVVGRPKVSALGHAQLTRNTELGQAVPRIVHGSKVVIRTAGGVRIVSGTF